MKKNCASSWLFTKIMSSQCIPLAQRDLIKRIT